MENQEEIFIEPDNSCFYTIENSKYSIEIPEILQKKTTNRSINIIQQQNTVLDYEISIIKSFIVKLEIIYSSFPKTIQFVNI